MLNIHIPAGVFVFTLQLLWYKQIENMPETARLNTYIFHKTLSFYWTLNLALIGYV